MSSYPHTGDTGTTHTGEEAAALGMPKTLTPLQLYYLRLLEQLLQQRQDYEADPEREEWLLMAINKATYSTFRSCADNGVEEEAKALLEQQRA